MTIVKVDTHLAHCPWFSGQWSSFRKAGQYAVMRYTPMTRTRFRRTQLCHNGLVLAAAAAYVV